MIGDVVGELAGSVLKFTGRVLLEVVFEFLIKGTGYVLCCPFSRNKPNPDGWLVVAVGLTFWTAIGIGIYAFRRLS